MKAALLVCDHILDKLIHIGGEYHDMFTKTFPEIEFTPYWVCDGQFPNSPDDHEIYFCTGSKHSVYDEIPWITELQKFVSALYDAEKKLIGSCFGHQMIAHALGGKVEKVATGWTIGVHKFDIKSKTDWIEPHLDDFKLLLMCQDQVTQLPQDSTVQASSKQCPVGIFTVSNHFLGIQPHPEFSKQYHQALYSGRSELIGQDIIDGANATMHLSLDTKILVDWIMNFLRRKA